MKRWVLFGGLIGLFLCLGVRAEDFTVATLPDTQNYKGSYSSMFGAQMQYLVTNAAGKNIKYVAHLGDLVDVYTDASQWSNAKSAMGKLDAANIPYGTVPGNHDTQLGTTSAAADKANYLANFGAANYSGKAWYGRTSATGLSNYQTFSAGGYHFLALNLGLETPQAEIDWAQGVLNSHPGYLALVSTHRYLTFLGRDNGSPQLTDGKTADYLFNNLIYPNKQIFMVQCGHFHVDGFPTVGEARRTSTNAFGLPVYEVLSDFQDYPNGGDGWLRLLNFRTDLNQINVQTYSPTLDQYRTGSASQFSLAVNFPQYVPEPATVMIVVFGWFGLGRGLARGMPEKWIFP